LAKEIERKFLLSRDMLLKEIEALAESVVEIKQGYIFQTKDRNVRVRIAGSVGYLTVKGQIRNKPLERHEFEYEIPVKDAESILANLCPDPAILKTRHIIPFAEKKWELDVFHGQNAGLRVAEIELESVDEPLSLPEWVGREITDDSRYLNSQLTIMPYRDWK
jgi:adenylate cyclase